MTDGRAAVRGMKTTTPGLPRSSTEFSILPADWPVRSPIASPLLTWPTKRSWFERARRSISGNPTSAPSTRSRTLHVDHQTGLDTAQLQSIADIAFAICDYIATGEPIDGAEADDPPVAPRLQGES